MVVRLMNSDQKYYGNLRMWLWTLVPIFHTVSFYLKMWRFQYLDSYLNLNIEGHSWDRYAQCIEIDPLLNRLDQFNTLTLWSLPLSLIVWVTLVLLDNGKLLHRGKMSPGAWKWHTIVHFGGWLINIILLIADPGGVIRGLFD